MTAALPPYIDMAADPDGTLRILGVGDTPTEAMAVLRDHLATDAGPIPHHAVYHSFALARGEDSAELRRLIAEDPTASAFYHLGRGDERQAGSVELRELGDERTRREALDRTLRDVAQMLLQIQDDPTEPALDGLTEALDLIREVLPDADTPPVQPTPVVAVDGSTVLPEGRA